MSGHAMFDADKFPTTAESEKRIAHDAPAARAWLIAHGGDDLLAMVLGGAA